MKHRYSYFTAFCGDVPSTVLFFEEVTSASGAGLAAARVILDGGVVGCGPRPVTGTTRIPPYKPTKMD